MENSNEVELLATDSQLMQQGQEILKKCVQQNSQNAPTNVVLPKFETYSLLVIKYMLFIVNHYLLRYLF